MNITDFADKAEKQLFEYESPDGDHPSTKQKLKKGICLKSEYWDEFTQIEKLLPTLLVHDMTMDGATVLTEMITKKKRNLVMKVYAEAHPKTGGKFARVNGYFRSRDPLLYGRTENELVEKLYNYYFSRNFEHVWYSWISECAEEGVVSSKTIEEYQGIYRNVLSSDQLFSKDISSITKNDLYHLFRRWTGNGKITKKDFVNRKSTLNGVFSFASERDLIPYNPVREVSCHGLRFKKPGKVLKAYTRIQRRTLLSYIESLPQSGYTFAARLACHLPLRIGEIRGIQWNDYDPKRRTLWIYRQVQEEREVSVDVDALSLTKEQRRTITKDPKGNPEYSVREIPLTSKAEAVIREAHRQNPFGEFLFMEYGRVLNVDTFNDHLRRYSSHAGVPYLSSHKLRFTVASHLYNGGNGIDLKILQRILGHSNLAMTLHYVEAFDGTDVIDVREDMETLMNYL